MYENINEYKHIILYINTFLTSFFKALLYAFYRMVVRAKNHSSSKSLLLLNYTCLQTIGI